MSAFLDALRKRASELGARIVLPETGDARTIEAAVRLAGGGLAKPVLIGSADDIRAAIERAGGDAALIEIVEPGKGELFEAAVSEVLEHPRGNRMDRHDAVAKASEPLTLAMLLVARHEVDGGVAGAVHATAGVLRTALRWIPRRAGIGTVSSSFYMVVPPFRGPDPEVLTFTDAAVLPSPDAEQLADIAMAAVVERRHIVGDEPRVAFLSYSTKGSSNGAETQKMRSAFEMFRSRMPDVAADGELQGDAALMPEVGRTKAPGSAVAGRANVLVFPDLDAGNIAYKLVQRLARAEALGPVLQGLSRPFNDLSRGASVEDIVNVACITALQSV